MSERVSCPVCNYSFDVEESKIGQSAACPQCGREFILGGNAEPDGLPRRRRVPFVAIAAPSLLLVLVALAVFHAISKPEAVVKAQKLVEAKSYDEAMKLLEPEQQQRPNDADVALLLGKCHLAKGDAANASECFKRMRKLEPKNARLVVDAYLDALDDRFETEGKLDMRLVEAAVVFEPTAAPVVAQACSDLASVALERHKLSDAVLLAQTAGEMCEPARTQAAVVLSQAVLAMAKTDWKAPDLRRIATLVLDWNKQAAAELAKQLVELSDPAIAGSGEAQRNWFEMLVQLDPNSRSLIGAVLVEYAQGQAMAGYGDKAASLADLAAEIAPSKRGDAADAYLRAAQARISKGDVDATTQHCIDRAAQLAPAAKREAAALCLEQAERLAKQGNTNAQEKLLGWAVRHDPRVRAQAAQALEQTLLAMASANCNDPDLPRLVQTCARWAPNQRRNLGKKLLDVSGPMLVDKPERRDEWFAMIVRLHPLLRKDASAFLIQAGGRQTQAGRPADAIRAAGLAFKLDPTKRAAAAKVAIDAAQKLIDAPQLSPQTQSCLFQAKHIAPSAAVLLAKACIARAEKLDKLQDAATRRKVLAWAIEMNPRASADVAALHAKLMHAALAAGRYDEAAEFATQAAAVGRASAAAAGAALETKGMELLAEKKDRDGIKLIRTAKQIGHKLSPEAAHKLATVRVPIDKFNVEVVAKAKPIGSVSLALNARGKPFIAYQDPQSNCLRLTSHLLEYWKHETIENGASPELGEGCVLVFGNDGSPRAAYCGDRKEDACCLKFAERQFLGKWVITNVPTDLLPKYRRDHGHDPSMVIDAHKRVHIAHWCPPTGEAPGLYYTYREDSEWYPERVDKGGDHPSLAIDSRGYAHIVAHTSKGNIKYYHEDSKGWHSKVIKTGAKVGCIALDSYDKPHFVVCGDKLTYLWYDGRRRRSKVLAKNAVIRSTQCLTTDAQRQPHVLYVTKQKDVWTVTYAYRDDKRRWPRYEVFKSPAKIKPDSLSLRLVDGLPCVTFSDGKTLWYAQP